MVSDNSVETELPVGPPRRHDLRYYVSILKSATHVPIADRRFWLIQVQVAVVLAVDVVGNLLQDRHVIAAPDVIWMMLLYIPLIYAGTYFGLAGSFTVAVEGIIGALANESFTQHTPTQRWEIGGTLASLFVVALVLGDLFERQHELRGAALTSLRQSVGFYESHPLYGKNLLGALLDGILLVDSGGTIHYANSALETMAGYGPGELNGQSLEVLVPASRTDHEQLRTRYFESPRIRHLEDLDLTLLRRDGTVIPARVQLAPYHIGDTLGVIATVTDDSRRRAAEVAQRGADQHSQLVFANSVSGIAILDMDLRAIAINDSFCTMLGRTRDELIGSASAPISHPDDWALTEDIVTRMLAGAGDKTTYTKRLLYRDGQTIWVEVSLSLARSDDGSPKYFISSVRDISEERALIDQLSHQAMHDELTGLANRSMFNDRLSRALIRATRERQSLAIFLFDLDDFKDVNDTFGHRVGDDLLVAVARRLEVVTRAGDSLCRFGGDEFLYLAEALSDPGDARVIAQRILGVFDEQFELTEGTISQSATLGFTVSSDTDDGVILVSNADTALNDAKLHHKGSYVLFEPEMHAVSSRRLTLRQELRKAVREGQIEMHYQPIVDLASLRVQGVEALMRWNHPTLGLVPPDVFIPLAEQSDLIIDLGHFALERALFEATTWQNAEEGFRPGYVAVNLSPRQFLDRDLVSHVRDALATSGLTPESLVLEITENAIFPDPKWATAVAGELRHLGVALAIDDFGTGHSSLSYFALLQPDILKIDRTFLVNSIDSTRGRELLQAIAELGHSLGARVVAEGVETGAQAAVLQDLGFHLAQGYLYSPAVASANLGEVFQNLGKR